MKKKKLNQNMFNFHLIIEILLFFQVISDYINPIPKGNGVFNDMYNHQDDSNLHFVLINFRHGARSPVEAVMVDNTDMLGGKWKGYGELTSEGRRQHYMIGVKNRKRYENFISQEFDPKEILVYSTHKRRALVSALSQMSGFYNSISFNDEETNFNYAKLGIEDKLEQNEIIYSNNKLNVWLPPVYPYHETNENPEFLHKTSFELTYHFHWMCKRRNRLVQKNFKSNLGVFNDIIKVFNDKYQQKINQILSVKDLDTFKGLNDFCDVFLSSYEEKDNYLNIQKLQLTNEEIIDMKNICEKFFYIRFMNIDEGGYLKNSGIIELSGLMKQMVTFMERRKEIGRDFIEYEFPKLVLYSGHDTTVIAMQKFLNTAFNIDFEYPQFAATQTFELREYNGVYYVEMFFNDLLRLNVTFDEFKTRINKVAWDGDDIYIYCQDVNFLFRMFRKHDILASFVILVILLGLFIYLCRIYSKRNISSFHGNFGKVEIE